MNKILDLVAQIKGQLKESITTELTPEEINKVALIDKSLDDLTEQVSKLQKDYDDLKTCFSYLYDSYPNENIIVHQTIYKSGLKLVQKK